MGTPYISFVVVGRNDNYLGDFLGRMQRFLSSLLGACLRSKLDSELVIVDWNPPKGRLKLENALLWGSLNRYCRVRIIEVPEGYHLLFPNANKMKLFEYPGKNVGVRRAKGEYVLSTNPDVLFSNGLIGLLAQKQLRDNLFYRTPRYDIDRRGQVVRQNRYVDPTPTGVLDYLVYRLRHFPYQKPFTNASGDFLLMHRRAWYSLQGYYEATGVDKDGFHHADSFILHKALFSGLKQKVLNFPIYHQEHGDSTVVGRPRSEEVTRLREDLLKKKVNFPENPNWGLGDKHLVIKTMRRNYGQSWNWSLRKTQTGSEGQTSI